MQKLLLVNAKGFIGNNKTPATNQEPEKLLPAWLFPNEPETRAPSAFDNIDKLYPADFNEEPKQRMQDKENAEIERLLPPGMNPCLDC